MYILTKLKLDGEDGLLKVNQNFFLHLNVNILVFYWCWFNSK